MKKIFVTFSLLVCFLCILILPVLLGFHASVMSDHRMNASDCIEHCMSLEEYSSISKISPVFSYVEILLVTTVFSYIFEVIIPLTLLYVALKQAPPNIYHKIKNYNYSCLIGIVKLTT